MKDIRIAIDGPASEWKKYCSQDYCKKSWLYYLDTGAMYPFCNLSSVAKMV